MPAPPIKLRPNAPVFGRFVLTKPSIVGQKKHTPIPNIIASTKAFPVEEYNKYNPMAATVVDINNNVCGANCCNTGLARPLPITMIPDVAVTINIGFPIFFNSTGTHCSVYSSVIAVPHIQMNININNGEAIALYMPAVETPEETRSVTGKSNFEKR